MGDSLGERFFGPADTVLRRIAARQLPPPPWRYTDDTEMALSVFSTLRDHGHIDQDTLARAFAQRMEQDRGYGRGAFEILFEIRRGGSWLALSNDAFGGKGSFGNGAAMRVAPLGAYFADDLERCVQEARLQSEITHSHAEGIAGGIAVAVATAVVWQGRDENWSGDEFLRRVVEQVPEGVTRDGITAARSLARETTVYEAAEALGNGSSISAQDTVPFCLWVASRYLRGSFEEAFWETVVALGDRDTTCAIVGGILGVAHQPPAEWIASCEDFVP